MTPRRVLMAGSLFWCVAIAATPLLASFGGFGSSLAAFSYDLFSRVCHQLESRSFHLAGHKFAVCIRCFMIYFSFFVGIVISRLINRTRIAAISPSLLLSASLLPMALDVGLSVLGIRESTTASRVVTGTLFGLSLSVVLLPVLEEVSASCIRFIITLLSHRIGPNMQVVAVQPADATLRNLVSVQDLLHPRNQNHTNREP